MESIKKIKELLGVSCILSAASLAAVAVGFCRNRTVAYTLGALAGAQCAVAAMLLAEERVSDADDAEELFTPAESVRATTCMREQLRGGDTEEDLAPDPHAVPLDEEASEADFH